jgi:GGDEF domain-containing protein
MSETEVGDDVLRAFAVLVRGSLREQDFCGRLDGTDFIVVLASVAEPFAAALVSDLMSAWSARSGTPSVAAGIAAVDEGGALVALGAAAEALRSAEWCDPSGVPSSGASDEAGRSAPP